MTYVAYHETKTAAQEVADRKADARWMTDHAPVVSSDDVAPSVQYRPAAAFDAPSAH